MQIKKKQPDIYQFCIHIADLY